MAGALRLNRNEGGDVRQALHDSEERYRLLVDRMPLGLVVFGPDFRIVEWNPAATRIFGWEEAEVLGRDAGFLVAGEARTCVGDVWRALLEGSGGGLSVNENLTKDGRRILCEWHNTPLVGGDGTTVGVASTVGDVTDRKRMQASLLQSDRMASLGTLAAGLAHEINNPLAYVTANLNAVAGRGLPQLLTRLRAIEDELATESSSYQLVERIEQVMAMVELAREGAERVRSIVHDLKTFSRGDDGAAIAVDVARVLDASVNLAWNEIRHRARLVKTYGVVPPIRASESRLGQVFLNVLVNAAQAIPEGRATENVIHVHTFCEGDETAVVEVTDTGCGIADEVVDRIFDPFFTTKPVGVGTGLGLWICQGIVASLGGEIRVRSRAGKGTTVALRLPLDPHPLDLGGHSAKD